MPSPFPGMDPYLEDPAIFPDLHDSLIFCLREALSASLPAPYYTGIASRAWIETSERHIGPDADVLHPGPAAATNGGSTNGGVAVVEAVDTEVVVVHVPPREVRTELRETFLEVYALPGGERLVTTLEVLSLTNKSPGAHNRGMYLQKQAEILESQVHLVEIDLLRGGTHSTAVPLDQARAQTGPFDYHVCVHRFDRRDDYFVYPIQLPRKLPVVAVPLLPGDPDVRVDLQTVLERCYEAAHYDRRVRYRQRIPVPPLGPEQAVWAERLLREQGIAGATPSG